MSVSAQVLMFKAVRGEATKTQEWNEEFVTVTKNVIIVYDMDEEKIRLVGEAVTDYFIISRESLPEPETKYDPLMSFFECVDSNGIKCNVKLSWFKDENVGFGDVHGEFDYRWSFYYGDVWYAYECNALK
jgi:hypothetical protein